MNIYHNRLASFKSSSTKWPHIKNTKYKAKPESFAQAGFYYTPTRTLTPNDNVTCFSCSKQLDGWKPNDDPFVEHASHAPTCAWCVLGFPTPAQSAGKKKKLAPTHTALVVDPLDSTTWPTSARMLEARVASFGTSWPHEGKEGYEALSVKKMAEGGFHFSPLPDSNDDAACAYCGLHLDGWTPGDDPIQEHRKREASCQFFVDLASLTATTTAVTVTSVPVAPPTKAPRGRRKKAEKPMNKDVADREEMDIDIDMDAQTDAGSVLDVEVEQEPERETRPVRGKSAAVEKKASAARRGRPARKEQEAAATEVETDLEVDTVAEEPRKKSSLEDDDLVSIADTDTESIAGGRKKRTRGTGKAPGRGKSAVADIDDDDAFSIMDADNSSEVSSLVNAPSRKESVGSVASVMTIAESVVSEAEPRRRGRKPKGGAMKAAAKTKGARTKVDEVDESETTTQDGAMDMADAASDAGGTQDATKTTDNLRNLDRMPFISVPVNPVPLTATRNPSLVSFRSFPTLPTTNVPPSLARRIEPILSTTLTKSGPPQPIILTEAEWNMTVQEYMDHLVEKQVERLDGEGRRMMGVFVGEAEKVARAISQRR